MRPAPTTTAACCLLLLLLLLLCLCRPAQQQRLQRELLRRRFGDQPEPAATCPRLCSCTLRNVNCARRKLQAVPTDMPQAVQRMNLQSNRISVIRRNDFKDLRRLRILQLQYNRIERIEPGAFDSLVTLERLRLNRNRLRSIPDNLFGKLPNLYRLDISHNRISVIRKATLLGAPRLRNLQMDHNEIRCITESALKGLDRLQILTLNKNNISTVPQHAFSRMSKLRTLRLADNNLNCDCRLTWLRQWLYMNSRFGLNTKCSHPAVLRDSQVADLPESSFQCSADHEKLYPPGCAMVENKACPPDCTCQDHIVRCNSKDLTQIPDNLPANVQELHLEGNKISRIPANAFIKLKELRRLFLSGNTISQIEAGAFNGLKNLYSLVLSRNQIRDLPSTLFRPLRRLQLLLLDANKITCVPADIFTDMNYLAIVSLYKNKIKSLANGTFEQIGQQLQQLTISNNPFVCDCNLRWLNDFVQRNKAMVGSDNSCAAPARMAKKRLGSVKSKKFRCREGEADATANAGRCELFAECPQQCACRGDQVDCSWRRLRALPAHLPVATRHLKLDNNLIKELSANSILTKLPNLESLDLSSNSIASVAPGSFRQNGKLEILNLSGNKLRDLDSRMLDGLGMLKILQMSNNRVTCLNNDTFLGTKELGVLSLSQNQLRCMMEGTFWPLKKLKALHLDMNPLHCNCHMSWLPQFALRHFAAVQHAQPVCRSPDLLMDTPAVSLKAAHFQCKRDSSLGCHGVPPCCSADAVSCDPRATCPASCVCDGTSVSCVGKGLTDVPDGLPTDATRLFLSQNRISQLNMSRLAGLRNLRLLDVSYNLLPGLSARMFENLTSLTSLTISFNKLVCIEPGAFAGLRKLRVLIMQGNQIASLPYGSFDDLVQLASIGLNQNPIHCDCNVKWLIDFFHKRSLDNGLAMCAAPAAMARKLVYHSRPDDFQCSGDSPVQSQCNACRSSPCANGGSCVPVSFDGFRCDCASGFVGERCHRKIDACFGSPCRNNATCAAMAMGRYSCHCPDGFQGVHCETNIDDCVGHKCGNNATCVDGVGFYSCSCTPGFSGKFCETRIRYCVDVNPCSNAATCVQDSAAGYRCLCVSGWEGANCERNINDCQPPTVCMNGGTCVDGVGLFSCRCRPGYSGRLCETLEMPGLIMDVPSFLDSGVCTRHECLNGGRCEQRGSEYRCKCLPGYEGKKCEKLSQVGFYSDSFAQVSLRSVFPYGNVTLVVATKQSRGILLYLGSESSFLMVSLFRGYLRFSYSLGVLPGANAYSFSPVNDGRMHTVSALLQSENLSIAVDGRQRRISAPLGEDSGDALRGPIFVGALSQVKRRQVQSNVNIRETFSFGGCVKQMFVNKRLVNFKLSHASNHKLIEGCPSFAERRDPCSKKSLCRNRAKCVTRPDLPDGYKCICRANYAGKHCEEKFCKRLVSRQFYIDTATGCKSRRKLKIRRCRGTCPKSRGYCCQPKKVKHRMIRFVCPGGRRITKRVTMVRRCGCSACGGHNLYDYWYRRMRN